MSLADDDQDDADLVYDSAGAGVEVAGPLRQCPDFLPQQVLGQAEVEEVVGMTAAVEPLSPQLQHLPIVVDSHHSTPHTTTSLQHSRPQVTIRTLYGGTFQQILRLHEKKLRLLYISFNSVVKTLEFCYMSLK